MAMCLLAKKKACQSLFFNVPQIAYAAESSCHYCFMGQRQKNISLLRNEFIGILVVMYCRTSKQVIGLLLSARSVY